MRQFIRRALQKLNKLTVEQIQALLFSAAAEIDRLETVLDSLTEGILVCDTEHNLIMANKYAERFLSLNVSEGSEPIWTQIQDDIVARFFETTLQSGDRVQEREFDVEVNGKQRLLSFNVLPLVRDRQVCGSLIYIEDITEKRSKEALMRRMENLASLTTLAAGVAHEIKNPLGSLSIHIQLIQKVTNANKAAYFEEREPDDSSETARYFKLLDKYLAVVNEEIDRLNHIVVDFLFAVRPMDMDLREGDINEIIRELISFVGVELEQTHIASELRLAKDLPAISFDERHIKQVLLNLIKNAIAAMAEGGVLTVITEATDTEVFIRINDTGIGIPEEDLSKIFEPYFTTKATGSGLGLTLVFKIIREHRGEITVKSRPNEGTCFTISLPIPQKEWRLIGYGGDKAETAPHDTYYGETSIEELRRLGSLG
ncbi:MAG: PAS domain-containing protein [Treponema sp.]|jgi:PAS domain S-box-containing protein|nr:PAS domain-containing protein [Treponema sp.]